MRQVNRHWAILMSVALLAVSAMAQTDNPDTSNPRDGEKTADVSEYILTNRAATDTGDLDGSQTFDRTFSVTFDGSCNATSLDSGNDGVSYKVFDIKSPGGGPLEATITLGTLDDSVMFLYCAPFDPLNPAANLVAWDDDDGAGLASAFTPGDGFNLDAGVGYQLVVTGFSPGSSGTFTLDLGGDAVFFFPVPTLGQWGLIAFIALLGIGGVMISRRRKALAA